MVPKVVGEVADRSPEDSILKILPMKRVTLIGRSNPFPSRFSFFKDEDQFRWEASQVPRSNGVPDGGKLASLGIELPLVREALVDCLRHWQPQTSVIPTP